MGAHQFILVLGAVALVTGCGISSTPTRALTGAAGDAVATAQRDALGLGDMAIHDTDNLPDLTFQTDKTLSLLGTSTLLVQGNSNLASLAVTNNAMVGGTLGVTGVSNLGTLGAGATTLGSLGVTGTATVGSTLGVTGVSTLRGNLLLNNGTNDVFSVAAASGNTTISGTLSVTGISSLGNTSIGALGSSRTLNINGVNNTNMAGNSFGVAGNSRFEGDAVVTGTLTASVSGNASTASHISGGTANALLYQAAPNQTTFLTAGAATQVLMMSNASTPTPSWVDQSSLSVGTASTASSATSASRISFATTPASSTSNCTEGQVAKDATYFYVCVAANSWKRMAWDTASW